MPLNKKGKKIMKAMKKQYGAEEGEAVFYASKNKGVIDDVERKALGGSVKSKKEKLAAIAEPFDEVTQRDVITARREKLKFKDGKSLKPLKVVGKTKKKGTKISFLPSKEIFSSIKFSSSINFGYWSIFVITVTKL